MIKVAHLVVITPKRCGLYETTRDLVFNLKKLDIDSRMVDPNKDKNTLHPTQDNDRGAPIADIKWAINADIIVSHSGLGGVLERSSNPVIHVLHGRPQHSFNSEASGSTPIYSYYYNKSKDPRTRAVVTFWPQHKPYYDVMWHPTPVHVISPPVDLDIWTSDGPSGYKFNGKKTEVNIICADSWRDDIDPFSAINGFALFAKEKKNVKLHLYGVNKNSMRGLRGILRKIKDNGNLGEVLGWVDGLANAYRAADLLITPHDIYVRSVREAMACGCPVLQCADPQVLASKIDKHLKMDRHKVRRDAKRLFNPVSTASHFKKIIHNVIDQPVRL